MKRTTTVGKPIDPDFTKKILTRLDAACIQAAMEVGSDMGFSIHQTEFKIDPLPDPITSIEFSLTLTLRKE